MSEVVTDVKLKSCIINFLREIDPNWILDEDSVIRISKSYQDEYLDILPRSFQIFTNSLHCPMKNGTHNSRCIWLEISEVGHVEVKCFASNHIHSSNIQNYNGIDTLSSPLNPETNITLAYLMVALWGTKKWNKPFKSVYSYLLVPEDGKSILRTYIANGSIHLDFHSKQSFFDLYASRTAYLLTNEDQYKTDDNSNISKFDNNNGEELGGRQNEEKDIENSSTTTINPKRVGSKSKNPPKSFIKRVNPASKYFKYSGRRDFNSVEYRPFLNRRYFKYLDPSTFDSRQNDHVHSLCGPQNVNLWRGFSVLPIESENPCPLILNHLEKVLVSGNLEHYNYFVNYLAWLIQHPDKKTQVVPIFLSPHGSGKSTLGYIILKIFGVHSIQLSHRRQLAGNFNGHMEGKNMIIVPETDEKGSKDEEATFKTATTDYNNTIEKKRMDVRTGTNYWNFIMFLNNPECFPAFLGDRRIFFPKVSTSKVGDVEYFNKLYEEIEGFGVGQFLFFLLRHKIPEAWTPFNNLPKNTEQFVDLIRKDPSNADLNWFLKKVEQGEWFYEKPSLMFSAIERIPVIQSNSTNTIPSRDLLAAFENEKQLDKSLKQYSQIKNIKDLKKFLKKLLPSEHLFKHKKISEKKQQYKAYGFASMKDISRSLGKKYNTTFREESSSEEDSIEEARQKKKRKITITLDPQAVSDVEERDCNDPMEVDGLIPSPSKGDNEIQDRPHWPQSSVLDEEIAHDLQTR